MRKNVILLFLFLASLTFAQNSMVTIDGLQYKLDGKEHTAMIANGNSWEGELNIPEQVIYEDEAYTVNRIEWLAFYACKTLAKVRIPKTVTEIRHYAGYDGAKNPFLGCINLECIEVDEANPSMCSVNGVLFNKDKTYLYCYPIGSQNETYFVPDGVVKIGGSAFANSHYLQSVEMPNSVSQLEGGLFENCKKLASVKLSESISLIPAYMFDNCENLHNIDIPQSVNRFGESVFRWTPLHVLVIRGSFAEDLRKDTFYHVSDSMVMYVQRSEIQKFRKVFSGTILPLSDYIANDVTAHVVSSIKDTSTYDVQGRRLSTKPLKGVYIQDGRKYVVR